MITQTISKQRTSGAMEKKDRSEWMIEPCTCAFWGADKKFDRGNDLRPISQARFSTPRNWLVPIFAACQSRA